MRDRSLVLLFLKSPEKGRVKSRLAKVIGEDRALEIYKRLVCDTLDKLDSNDKHFKICFYPPESDEVVRDWLGDSYSYRPQYGNDLGERMHNAFVEAFSTGREKVLLIGSDIPGLSVSLIDEAFISLDSNGAAIGPANDGGYYLIGFNRPAFLPGIFQGIEWGTDSVYLHTMDVLKRKGTGVHVLKMLTDVDTYEDLLSLRGNRSNLFVKDEDCHALFRALAMTPRSGIYDP